MKEKVILIASTKGGCGKTLIADELAFAFDREKVPYSLYDLDQQGGLIHAPKETPKAKVSIVDTPGALQSDMVTWMRSADLVIIPTKMTTRDVPPLITIIDLMEQNKIKAKQIFVLNGWNRYRAAKEFAEWFNDAYPGKVTVEISQSEAFTQAALNGQSVVDYQRSSTPAQQILRLIDLAKSAINL